MAKGLDTGENTHDGARSVGLPARPFLYTIDQLAVILELREASIKQNYLYYEGRSIGVKSPDLLEAKDIAPPGAQWPDWRVAERELIRWMKRKGFRFYERASARS